jgi:hypothetical protein
VKLTQTPPPQPPLKPKSHKHENQAVTDGLQLGHDASSLGEHGLKSKLLSEWTRDEVVELRSALAKEGRQAGVMGEHSSFGSHNLLAGGVGILNGAVAASALWHGIDLLRSDRPLHKVEGVNHLLMGAGCGLVSAHLLGGNHHLGQIGSHFLSAHGAGEVGIGLFRAAKGEGRERTYGLLQAAHGACLMGAEMVPGAALPLCLAMAGLTGVQIWLHHHPAHQDPPH